MAIPSLLAKIEGALAATSCASAMAAPTRGLTLAEIQDRFGRIEDFLPSPGPGDGGRAPGMTTGAMEKQDICATAVIEKRCRIDVSDLARTWVRDLGPEQFGHHLGTEERMLYDLLVAGMPPFEVGRHAPQPGSASTCAILLPIGIVNAGDPREAVLDVHAVGRCLDVAYLAFNRGLECAAALQAGVAEALRPAASKESVLEAVSSHLAQDLRDALQWGLELGGEGHDASAWGMGVQERYGARRPDAIEALAAAGALLSGCGWDPKAICLAAANMGRDGESAGICANSLAGALAGIKSIPSDWVALVDGARAADSHSVIKRDIRESAAGLCQALLAELDAARSNLSDLQKL